jgi:hypothetical protein
MTPARLLSPAMGPPGWVGRDALGQTKLELIFVPDSECRIAERSGHRREAVALAGEFRQGRQIEPYVLAHSRTVPEDTRVGFALMATPVTEWRCCAARTGMFACDHD